MQYKPNDQLMNELGMNLDQSMAIESIGQTLYNVLDAPDQYGEHKDVVDLIEHLEFSLQILWGFDQDSRYHKYWYRVKGCDCPKLDNQDSMYFGRRVINKDCPYHGDN